MFKTPLNEAQVIPPEYMRQCFTLLVIVQQLISFQQADYSLFLVPDFTAGNSRMNLVPSPNSLST